MAKSSRVEVKFSGFGGQGIALMGGILGEAVSLIEEGKNAIMTQNYGPESRGGASSSDVVLDTKEIDFPLATEIDHLITMSEEAYIKYIPQLKKGGILFYDEGLVKVDDQAKKAKRVLGIPATKIAESLGNRLYANIVMLGFVCANSDLVSESSLISVLKKRIKAVHIPKNLVAFERGKTYKTKDE